MKSPLAALAALALAVGPARAQDNGREYPRGWGTLGLGTGSANITCNGCTSGWKHHGPTLLITVGVMLNPHLGVGVGLDQWWRSPSDSEATNTGTFFLRYRPIARAGAFVDAGVGLSRAVVRLDANRTASGRHWGALMAAVGYDGAVIRTKDADITLTPRASYVYSSVGDLRYAAGSPPFATGWRHQVLSVGLGVGFMMTTCGCP